MAKINKKKQKNVLKKKNLRSKTVLNKFEIKDCFVNLHKIDHLIHRYTDKTKQDTLTKCITMQIRKGILKIDDLEMAEGPNRVFEIDMRIEKDFKISVAPRLNCKKSVFAQHSKALVELIKEQCELIVKPKNSYEKQSMNVKPYPKSLLQLIDAEWSKCLKEKRRNQVQLTENLHVMAQMKGFSPSPGRISSFTKNRQSTKVY